MIYITGDSHRGIYLNNNNIIDCGDYHTIFSFTKKLSDGLVLDNNITEYDYILIVYGEIDVRHHFANQIMNNRTIEEIVGTLIDEFTEQLKKINSRIIIRGIVAPLPNEYHPFGGKNSITASFEERIKWRKMMNTNLEIMCKNNNFIYLPPSICEDVYGVMNLDMSDNLIHIKETPEMCELILNDLMNVCL